MSNQQESGFVLTEEDKANALDEIFYEIQQLYLSILLTRERMGHSEAAMNAFLESALVHFRVVLDFFEHPEREKDDVLCSDYGFEPRKLEFDETVSERLNKRLAHLTYLRARQGSIEDKRWDLPAEARPLIERSIEFIDFLAESKPRFGSVSTRDWQNLRSDLEKLLP